MNAEDIEDVRVSVEDHRVFVDAPHGGYIDLCVCSRACTERALRMAEFLASAVWCVAIINVFAVFSVAVTGSKQRD